MMVSFDVVFLFTKFRLKTHWISQVDSLIKTYWPYSDIFHKSTYFTYSGHFYEQTDGVAMGSPPVIADFFVEDFEAKAIQLAANKPTCWFRHVDDTFVIWPHGIDKLRNFLTHLNSINKNIQFTMETEEDNHLPFLDIDIYERPNIYKRPDGTLGHKVYRKPTHTNLYLNANSHHHPSSKQALLNTMVHTVHSLCDSDSLRHELDFLKITFKKNGYNSKLIHRAQYQTS
jgi:hypothetical protein